MLFRKFSTTVVTALLLTGSCLSSADDTDIFLSNPNYDSTVKPNVLFLLDNSGSMASHLQQGKTRMDVMKESFEDILGNSSNINAGIMKLWARSGESSELTYPVSDIDAPYGGTNISRGGKPTIKASTDDAYEFLEDNSVSIASDKLILGEMVAEADSLITPLSLRSVEAFDSQDLITVDKSISRENDDMNDHRTSEHESYMYLYSSDENPKTFGFRFRDLDIPSNAIIEEAKLSLHGSGGGINDFKSVVYAELSKSPTDYIPGEELENRIGNATGTLWNDPSKWTGRIESTDIKSSIQEVLDRLDWSSDEKLNDLSLLVWMGGHYYDYGFRVAYQFKENLNPNLEPKLKITYRTPPEEPGEYLTGLRFQEVGIPRGATITNASLQFTAAKDSSDNVTYKIKAGELDTGNGTAPFSIDSENLSSRDRDDFTSVNWTPESWIKGATDEPNTYEVSIQPLLQEIVNDSGWCGNDSATFFIEKSSGIGKRVAYSYDSSLGNKPKLIIEFTPPTTPGCSNEILDTRIFRDTHDAYQERSGPMNVYGNELKLRGRDNTSTDTYTAIHYKNFPIKQGATILEARLELTSSRNSTGDMNLRVMAEDKDTTPALVNQNNNISSRRSTLTDARIDWPINESWLKDRVYSSPDITRVIQEIVGRSGWQAGNNLTLLINAFVEDQERYAVSFKQNPTYSPRLIIKVESGGIESSATYKVKDHMISIVEQMTASGGTPIVPRMYDTAKYFTDEFEGIQSPINNACQSNHFVILTDGSANGNTSEAKNGIKQLTGSSSCTGNDNEYCGRNLSNWFANNDLSSDVNRVNNLTTHTIAFATSTTGAAATFMSDLAAEGGGKYYQASNAKDLANAFNQIVEDVIENESTFAAPGVAANSYNRSEHRNKIYYSIFKPSQSDRWQGNLKKYQIFTNPLGIYDNSSPASIAVDSDSGFFKEEAQSFWSTEVDGSKVSKGGFNSRLKGASGNRKIYTYLGNNPAGSASSITNSSNKIITSNNSLTTSLFGLNSNEGSRKNELINWIADRSKGIGDPLHSTPALVTYKCDGTYSESAPFDCAENDLDLALYLGTNDGLLHGMNAKTGNEHFAYMPKELLPKADKWEANDATDRVGSSRPYGLDGHIVVWANDINRNGVIYGGADTLDSNSDQSTVDQLTPTSQPNPGEFVYAYAGMRRGGRNYYALDVTDKSSPKMLWYIKGGTGQFKQLGQTWSRPVLSRIRVGNTVKEVLIFSGGYDPIQDQKPLYDYTKTGEAAPDEMGNAIYIVDAKTGELIWSASGTASSNPTLYLSKMKYSIPGGVSVVDLQGDGFVDQLFFADTGGQVWRLYINSCIPDSVTGSISECAVKNDNQITDLVWPTDSEGVNISDGNGTAGNDDGVFASLGYNSTMVKYDQLVNARKFYTSPDLALIPVNGRANLAVSIGSGMRPDPLSLTNAVIKDHFYVLTTPHIYNPEVTSSNKTGKQVPAHSVIKLTTNGALAKLVPDSTGIVDNSAFGGSSNQGWYLEMRDQEKVMSDPSILNGQIYFNSYKPSSTLTDSCTPVAGEAWSWQANINGSTIVKEKINSNGIVGNSVFLNPDNSFLNPNPNLDSGNPGSGGSNSGGNQYNGDKILICNNTHCKYIESGILKGSTFWEQVQ